VTGYWFLNQTDGWQPTPELEAFLKAGPPPVYVGFGSMAGRNPRRLANIVINALRVSGMRGIIATGWGGLQTERLPPTLQQIDQAPHAWLFPRMAAVVHHGGAGTTAAALQAGRPSVIVPFFGDQPFWGQRVHMLGGGSRPIAQKKLTVEKLAAAIKNMVSDPLVQKKAENLGEKIRHENGIRNAVEIIEKIMNKA
jgi:sterol 3beta-glucosyltransferase